MDKCKGCGNKIEAEEIYGDWFYCRFCHKEWTYLDESLEIKYEKDKDEIK